MLVELKHKTEYRYSNKVFLEPHILRLIPKSSFFSKIESYDVRISPEPSTLTRALETDGSCSYSASFLELVENLYIEHTSLVNINNYNPLDFVIYPLIYSKVPYETDLLYSKGLKLYMESVEQSKLIRDLAYKISIRCKKVTLNFLTELNIYLNRNVGYKRRLFGEPQKASITLDTMEGSCRDIAFVFIEICRFMKIPARFVSGYALHEESDKIAPELHAWAEVYIPGAGWVGYDPTNGVMCYGRHVPLVSSFKPSETMPVSGTFRGEADSEIYYEISCQIAKHG